MGDLSRQQLDSLCAVAENYGLGDIELREESVQAVELFLLLEVGVKLCETLESEFVSEPYELGVWDIFLLEIADLDGVGCAKHEDLLLRHHDVNNLFDNFSEVVRQ